MEDKRSGARRTPGNIQYAWFLIILCISFLSSAIACPSRCMCYRRGERDTTDCGSLGLLAIPRNISTGLHYLYLQKNNITNIGAMDFNGLTMLEHLGLSGNRINNIHADAFSDLSNLITLYLSDNMLTHLDTEIFAKLTKLRTVGIDGNRLTTLAINIFAKQSSLRTLNIEGNPIYDNPGPSSCVLELLGPLIANGLLLTTPDPLLSESRPDNFSIWKNATCPGANVACYTQNGMTKTACDCGDKFYDGTGCVSSCNFTNVNDTCSGYPTCNSTANNCTCQSPLLNSLNNTRCTVTDEQKANPTSGAGSLTIGVKAFYASLVAFWLFIHLY